MAELLLTLVLFLSGPHPNDPIDWTPLPSLPDSPGVASPFAGLSDHHLIVAGGANFPDAPPWEGGTKVWHDTVYGFSLDDRSWSILGKLPQPRAYGVSVHHGDRMICVGGSDADRHYSDVFSVSLKQRSLVFETLPSLPMPVANACGAVVNETLFVAGGTESPNSTSALRVFLSLDLATPNSNWIRRSTWPGPPRMLAVAASDSQSFFLFSGADLRRGPDGQPQRTYLKDAYRYDPRSDSWTQLPEMPFATVAAPSPAIALNQSLVIPGGDDGSQVGTAPGEHTGFSSKLLEFQTSSETWTVRPGVVAPRVTVPLVNDGSRWFLCSGEKRPGVRSPEVWQLQFRPPPPNP